MSWALWAKDFFPFSGVDKNLKDISKVKYDVGFEADQGQVSWLCLLPNSMLMITILRLLYKRQISAQLCKQRMPSTGLILYQGNNEVDCLHAPWSLPWCP